MLDAINLNALLYAGLGTGVTFLCTALGAAAVFLVKPATDAASASRAKFMETISLGFAAGIMIAAAVWSLLIPALDMVESSGGFPALGNRRVSRGRPLSKASRLRHAAPAPGRSSARGAEVEAPSRRASFHRHYAAQHA